MKNDIKRDKNNGFTLVELLAVIVILAIILVIAVPQIMDTIEDAKKATLESTAKMIASAAEKQKVQNTVLGKNDEITCDSVAKINDADYANCDITFEDNTAKVTIKGSGKFDGLYVCNGTKTEASADTEGCTEETLVSHIQSLYANETTRTSNGLTKDNTVDENIRYSGSNEVVKNYVEFGNTNEIWRIIGIFEMKTADGKTEELVKIVREDSIGNMSWDSSASDINVGYGINQWGASTYTNGSTYEGADLMQLLNGYYIGENDATCTYCNASDQSTCLNDCSSTVTPINSTYKNMIESVIWNTSAINGEDTTIFDFETYTVSTVGWYNGERGTVGKTCSATNEDGSENTYCNDTVTRTSEWEGLVALPYASDWGYASSENACRTNMFDGFDYVKEDFTNMTCKKNNWMHYGSTYSIEEVTWFLSPIAYPDGANRVSFVVGAGFVSDDAASFPLRVRPTLYLKSNIQIKDGDGSIGNAYKLK